MRLRLSVALLALTLAAPATADEDLRRAFRLEATVGAGWADRATLAGGGRLVLRVAPLVFSLGGQAGASAGGGAAEGTSAPELASVWTLGAGLTRDVGAWQADASALLGLHTYAWPAIVGLGETRTSTLLLGVRVGAGRHVPLRALGWTTYVGTSVTVTLSGSERSRIREMETSGLVALVTLDVGLGRPLR
jgi:hypothetical protein